jgi:Domain of unknown function (DUF5658)
MAIPIPDRFRREFPAPSLSAFLALQVLDIITTLLGLRVGAEEASLFLNRLMHIGPLSALLLAKILAVALVATALRMKRPRVVVFLNYWFAAVVTWNLANILWTQLQV